MAGAGTAGIIALATAVVVAIGLSARPGPGRRVGLLIAALAALAVAAALGHAERTGVFATFKAPQTPLDPLKTVLLTLDMIVAVGLGLLFVVLAVRGERDDHVPVTMANGATRYGYVSRFFHWSIAALIVSLVPLGLYMAGLPQGVPEREGLYDIHKSLGLTVLLLAIARIIWGRISRLPPLSPDLSRGNRIGAKAAHVMLYVLMLGFPITGYLLSSLFGKPVVFFGAELPRLITENKGAALPFAGLHKIMLPLLLYIVLALHVIGALKHRFLDRQDDALERMTG